MFKHRFKIIVLTISALVLANLPAFTPSASAVIYSQFQQAFVRLDRMKVNEWTGFTVCATAATDTVNITPQNGNELSVTVVIPQMVTGTDFLLNTTATNWVADTTNIPATIPTWTATTGLPAITVVPWPGVLGGPSSSHASAVSNTVPKTVTFDSTALTVGTTYCFHVRGDNTTGTHHTLQNGSDAVTGYQMLGGTVFTSTNAVPTSGVTVNQTNYSLALYADDTIVLAAVVPPLFQFSLQAYLDSFSGNLDTGAVSASGGVDVSVKTNAKGGWIGWVKDQYQGLHSASANYTMPSDCITVPGVCTPTPTGTVNGVPSTLVAGTEGYVIAGLIPLGGDSAGGCTINIDPEYDGTVAATGGTPSASFQSFAYCTGPAPATADDDHITVKELASIRGGTPAGSDYTDSITVVGAGNF